MEPVQIQWCDWADLLNPKFLPIVDCDDRYLILWGGRGSSKSYSVPYKLIYRCLSDPYFKFILIRNNYNSIKDTSYSQIKNTIYTLRLESLFEFKLQPLEIICKYNGNSFLARGCDDTTKLKSIVDPTGAWYEEDIPEENDFITITTSIRTQKASYLQEVFSINPEVDGDYKENWFWKKFFKAYDPDKSFRGVTEIEYEGETIESNYTCIHSTHRDNPYLPLAYRAQLEDFKTTNPYYYSIYTLGEWGNRILGGLFYKNFVRGTQTGYANYNPEAPLHVTFDFNVYPYMSCSIWQLYGKKLYCVGEVCAKTPNNTTFGVCKEIKYMYPAHRSGMFIYGDPSGNNLDTRVEQRTEKGFNDYRIIDQELRQYSPSIRVANSHPSVTGRGNFINHCFAMQSAGKPFEGIEVVIGEQNSNVIRDFMNIKEEQDGTKFKEKKKDKESGITSELYGHFSDGFDYLFMWIFASEYGLWKNGGEPPKPIIGRAKFRSY